jgi:hypothetical protein
MVTLGYGNLCTIGNEGIIKVWDYETLELVKSIDFSDLFDHPESYAAFYPKSILLLWDGRICMTGARRDIYEDVHQLQFKGVAPIINLDTAMIERDLKDARKVTQLPDGRLCCCVEEKIAIWD